MQRPETMGMRRFGAVNWLGLGALVGREVRRFASIWSQTVLAPTVTSVLFLAVFLLAFDTRGRIIAGIGFADFLAPGILMMSVIQNAFANSSSSIVVAKIQGSIVDTLMPPLSPGEILAGYTLGAAARGIVCAAATGLAIFPVIGLGILHPLWALAFVVSGSLMLGLVGVLAGIYSEKFDQMAAITNFAVTPLAFLSGTFYSIRVLPEPFLTLSHLNPVFYLIDGFRAGFTGVAEAPLLLGAAVSLVVTALLGGWSYFLLQSGYKLKS